MKQLEGLLAHSSNLAAEEWGLIATLLVEAAETTGWSESGPQLRNERFDRILADLREMTDDFGSSAFIRATRAARRQNPALFA